MRLPPAVVAPSRPPYGLAGMATTVEDGVAQRTAILSSLQGVSLVKEGDVLDDRLPRGVDHAMRR